jgi:hypothetical protein
MYKNEYQQHQEEIKQYKKDMQNIRHKLRKGKKVRSLHVFFRGEGKYEVYGGRLIK